MLGVLLGVIDAAESIPDFRFFNLLLLFLGFMPYFGFCVQCVRRKITKSSIVVFCVQCVRRKITKSSIEINITMLGT